jgi:hypothetical protein
MGIEIGVRDPHAVHKICQTSSEVNVGQVSAKVGRSSIGALSNQRIVVVQVNFRRELDLIFGNEIGSAVGKFDLDIPSLPAHPGVSSTYTGSAWV